MQHGLKQDLVSQVHLPVSCKRLWIQIWFIGLVTYGGPLAHIGIFKKMFVDDLRWVENDIFIELATVCQSIPGPTSTQLLIAISMISTQSILGGFMAFIIFASPTFFVLMLAGFFFRDYFGIDSMVYIMMYLEGVLCVAVAVIAQAFWGLSTKYRNDKASVIVIALCCIIYVLRPTVSCMIVLFATSTLFSIYLKAIPAPQTLPTSRAKDTSFMDHKFLGKNSFILFTVLLFIMVISPSLITNTITNEISIFYRIGSIIIGGGHVVLPIMLNQLEAYNYMRPQEFWNGFALVSCLPGPMFNITSYIGYLINGVIGSIICTLSLNLPAILSLLAVMPYWNAYRSNQKVQKIIDGLCCSSLGLIASAAYLLLDSFCLHDNFILLQILQLGLVVLGYYLIQYRKWPIFVTMILAGAIQFPLQLMKYRSQSN